MKRRAREYKLTHDGVLALARAEQQGIRLDMDLAEKNYKKLTKEINSIEKEFKTSDFYKAWDKSIGRKTLNMNSNQQLADFLYTVKKIKPAKLTKSGKGSTDDEALKALGIPETDDILRLRKLRKLRDTYLKGFMEEAVDGYIHPTFNLHTVATFRSSSDSPNFQNIPVRDTEAKEIIRGCLFPRPGHQLLEIDYSQLEVRIAACYHEDPTMLKYLKDNLDMHLDMAKQIFVFTDDEFDKHDKAFKTLRSGTKNGFVFPQFYGDYYGNNAIGLSQWATLPIDSKYKKSEGLLLPSGINLGEHLISHGIESFFDFRNHLKKIERHFWKKRFPVYAQWKEDWRAKYRRNGEFEMLTGYRCKGIMGANDVVNYPVQGAAFHCLLWTFIEMDRIMREEGWDTKLIGQVHDSIIFDVNPDELKHVLKTVQDVAENKIREAWDWIIVPLQIEAELSPVDGSWLEKDEIDLAEFI